jgi:outer membrane immunogenic protein
MKKLLLATTALACLAAPAMAADMPVKAPPAVAAAVNNWSGFYVGIHTGYQWSRVRDEVVGGFIQTDSTVRHWLIGFHGGAQIQVGSNPWGGWLLGVEASVNTATQDNSTSNFTPCANPAFSCGLRRIEYLVTVGPRVGIAANNWLWTVSGGWANARLDRTDLNAAGVLGAGGGASSAYHNGWYVGTGLEYALLRGQAMDVIIGVDYQHIRLNPRADLDVNGVAHTLSTNTDQVRARLTFKFNPFGAVVARY